MNSILDIKEQHVVLFIRLRLRFGLFYIRKASSFLLSFVIAPQPPFDFLLIEGNEM